MYNRILVPLDGSKLSESILEHVKGVAGGCRASEVVLLMVVEQAEIGPVQSWGGLVSAEQIITLRDKAMTEAKSYIGKVAERLSQEGIPVKTCIVKGSAADAILDYAQENRMDLIIMSTHGRSGISHWAFGSVASRVTHHSPVPVFLAPPKEARAK
ncbi:MAG: universal stress protein [Dehalococcoidales bacterium]|nr:universal stress protein [Dehalococcoidales bacterium]